MRFERTRFSLALLLYRWALRTRPPIPPCSTCGADPCHDHCRFCGGGWTPKTAEIMSIEHRVDCPMVTKVYPVEVDDLWPHGFACVQCGEAFRLGEFYTTIEEDVSAEFSLGVTAEVYAVVCLGCAAEAEVLDE